MSYKYVAACKDCVWSEDSDFSFRAAELAQDHADKFKHETFTDLIKVKDDDELP